MSHKLYLYTSVYVCLIMCPNAIAANTPSCEPGYYISNGECVKPPEGTVSFGGISTKYYECNWTKYTNTEQSACVECPPEYPWATYRNPSINSCLRVCMGGTYMANPTDTKCTEVEPGFWAPLHIYYYGHDATTDETLHKCPDGTMTLGGIGIASNSVSDCAHTLHIGDNKMRVVGNKNTTPALAVLIDGKTYYARMSIDSHTISVDAPQKLRIGIDGVNYYVFDDTIATRAPYPWESADYNWSENGNFTYDTIANTWEINFGACIWTGTSKCVGTTCYCKMASPAITDWVWRLSSPDCETRCALECGWGYSRSPMHKYTIISTVDE